MGELGTMVVLIIGMRAAKLLQIIVDKTWVEQVSIFLKILSQDFYFKIDKAIGYLSSIGVWSWWVDINSETWEDLPPLHYLQAALLTAHKVSQFYGCLSSWRLTGVLVHGFVAKVTEKSNGH